MEVDNLTIHDYLCGNAGDSEVERRAKVSTYWEAVKETLEERGSELIKNLSQSDKDYLFQVKESLQKSYR